MRERGVRFALMCCAPFHLMSAAGAALFPATEAAWNTNAASFGDFTPDPAYEAWWTGPLVAAPAITLPRGHFYIEPYLFDTVPYAVLDNRGRSHATPGQNNLWSMIYLKYGVTDRLTIGLTPHFYYDWVDHGESSSAVGTGDLPLQVEYRLTPFSPDTAIPTVSIDLAESLPTGRFDQLQRSSDGFGSGAYTTTTSIYLQSLVETPNRRSLRLRLDLSLGVSRRVRVVGQSVYGTTQGFSGYAEPGLYYSADLAFEYSMTRNWVLSVDFWQQWQESTPVTGIDTLRNGRNTAYLATVVASREFTIAPALEYNWSERVGIIVGTQVITRGRNCIATVSSVVAFSYLL
jgi:hypothetical protein